MGHRTHPLRIRTSFGVVRRIRFDERINGIPHGRMDDKTPLGELFFEATGKHMPAPIHFDLSVLPTLPSDCRSKDGVTIGLIDAIISIARILAPRDCSSAAIREALSDLRDDEDVAKVVGR